MRANEPADGTFSWRVVAKRKDIAGVRFEPVDIPREPALPDVPASAHEVDVVPPPIPPAENVTPAAERIDRRRRCDFGRWRFRQPGSHVDAGTQRP